MKRNKTVLSAGLGVSLILFAALGAMAQLVPPKATVTTPGGPTVGEVLATPSEAKARIAVARFTDKTGKGWWSGQIGDGMADMLATALFHTARFIVVERGIIKEMIEEQELAKQGLIKREAAVPTGQWEAADQLVTGAVTEFEPGAAGAGGGLGGGKRGSIVGGIFGGFKRSHIAIDLRLVDAATRRIVSAARVEGSATDIAGGVGALGGSLSGVHLGGALSGWSKTPLEKALRIALNEGVNFVASQTPAQYYRPSAPPPAPTQTLAPAPAPPVGAPAPAPTVAAPAPSGAAAAEQLQVISPSALVRLGPGNDSQIVGRVSQGTQLVILNETRDWFNVRLPDGREGWILKEMTK